MAKYFNTMRSALPLQLVGKSTSVPAKGYLVIEGEDESTDSVRRAVASGKLRKMPLLLEVPAPAPGPVSVEVELAPSKTLLFQPKVLPKMDVTPGDIKDKKASTGKAVENPRKKEENIATTDVLEPKEILAEKKVK